MNVLKHSVFLIDAHKEQSDVYKSIRQSKQLKISKVSGTGEEASNLVSRIQYDAVLINYHLPDLSGTELAKFFKKISPGVPIFIYTSEFTMNTWREVSKAGATMLPMPIDPNKITSILGVKEDGSYEQETAATKEEVYPQMNDFSFEQSENDTEDIDAQLAEINEVIQSSVVLKKQSEPEPYKTVKREIQQRSNPKRMMKYRNDSSVILTYSPKGGVGKTTTSVNLATYAATYTDKSVALIELTRQSGDILSHFDLTPTTTLQDWVKHMPTADDALSYMIEDYSTGLYILPTQSLLEEVKEPMRITVRDVKRILPVLRDIFDVIIIDGGTILDDSLVYLMQEADHILLVSKIDNEALQLCHYIPEILYQRGIDTSKVIHLLNQAKKGLGMKAEEAFEMVNISNKVAIQYDQNIEKIREKREPFIVYKAKSKYTSEMKELYYKLFEEENEIEDPTFLKKILRVVKGA